MMLLGRPMFPKDSETAAAAAHYSYIFLSLSLFHTYVRNTANVNSRQLIHNRSSKKERKKERKRNDDDDDDVQSSFRRNIYCSKSRSTNSLFLLAHTHTHSLSLLACQRRGTDDLSLYPLQYVYDQTPGSSCEFAAEFFFNGSFPENRTCVIAPVFTYNAERAHLRPEVGPSFSRMDSGQHQVPTYTLPKALLDSLRRSQQGKVENERERER